jgi:hypothetical protein
MKTPRLLALCLAASLAFSIGLAPITAADYSVTATSVVPSTASTLSRGTAGATITAGQAVAIDVDHSVKLFDANSGTAALRVFAGIACNGASSGQPVNFCSSDPSFTPGFTVAAGAIVIGSATAGALCPAADLATGSYLTVVGVGIGSNKIKLAPIAAGVATP